jgi:ribonucrease Y
MSILVVIGCLVGGIFVGMLMLHFYKTTQDSRTKMDAQSEAQRIVAKAKAESARIEREAAQRAKDFEQRARRNVENDVKKEKQKVVTLEQTLKQKESRLDQDFKRKEETLANKIKSVDERGERLRITEGRIADLEKRAQTHIEELRGKLESVAALSTDQAKEELKNALKAAAQQEAEASLQEIEKEAKLEADRKAKRILSVALSRYASEVATERTVNIVPLTSDEMKGKIIGREGRNIRALEAACGVDLIIDETPEAVVISSFDPVRREVARQTLIKLMEDGRVHPGRIEEVVDKVKQDLTQTIKQDGEKAAVELGLVGIHQNIIQLIGSMKYRLAGSQNLYQHSIEVAHIAGLLAAEIGEDVQLAKRIGLLHDLGKTIDHNVEGSVAHAGAEFARRHGEKDILVNAIKSLAPNEEARSALSHIVQAAKALAENRPGANRQVIQNFIRRLEDLESIGNSFDGVVRTYALQSGKEIRVLVESSKITDDQAVMLSRDIARKIEREANYPGQIKIAVVRETRVVEHAR